MLPNRVRVSWENGGAGSAAVCVDPTRSGVGFTVVTDGAVAVVVTVEAAVGAAVVLSCSCVLLADGGAG